MSKEIRDASGRLLGTVREHYGDFVLLDANGDVLGGWNSTTGVVRDASGRYVATGPLSTLAVLLPRQRDARGEPSLNGASRL